MKIDFTQILNYISLVLFVLITGCSSFDPNSIAKPKVDVDTVDVTNLTSAGATVVIDLKVDNPNSFALPVNGLKYEIDIGGRPFTTGQLDSKAKVAANSTSSIKVPIALKYTDVFQSLTEFLRNRTAPYQIRGTATVGFIPIPFSHTGDLKFN